MPQFSYSGYPQNVLHPSTPYVYFDSLLQSDEGGKLIYNTVKPYFEKQVPQFTYNNNEIDQALQYLQTVINTEASKEMAFINYFEQQFNDISELKPPTLQSDWTAFVQAIQQKLSIGNNQLNNLRTESLRLQRNQQIAKDQNLKNYDFLNTTADYNSQQISTLYNILKGSKRDSASKEILELILNKFGAKLFQLDENGFTFSPAVLSALIIAIQSLLLRRYANMDLDNLKRKPDLNKIQSILETDNEFTKEINAYIDRVQALPFLGEDLTKALGFIKIDDNYSNKDQKILNELYKQYITTNKITDSSLHKLQTVLGSKNLFTQDNIKLISNGNAYSEIESMLVFALQGGTIFNSNTGASGAKPDNLLAYLSIDLSSLDLTDQIVREQLTNIHNAMLELDNSLDKTNDMQYYQKQQQSWNDAQKKIEEALAILEQKYKDLDCFIIEDSTKNYTTLYRNEFHGITNSDFHGGSLGPNIADQISKLDALRQVGGLSAWDEKWLLAAAINMGPNMIARSYKREVERYLSTFACILLFDDQINIAKEAMHQVTKQANQMQSHVHKIHLFSLNGGYYPLSYILQLTYNDLAKAYTNTKEIVLTGSGAKVSITGFVNEPEKPYKDTDAVKLWATTAEKAKATTKIKISFLTNFMNVLNSLYPV